MSLLERLLAKFSPAAPASPLPRGRGWTVEVVGEASYQGALNRICGGKCEEGYRRDCTATLALEDGNPHDRNAVSVHIDRQKVGYLNRADALSFRAWTRQFGQHRFSCDARIVGGWDRGGGDTGHYGVKLSISSDVV